MSRTLAPFAILACLAGAQAQVATTANGIAQFTTANVTFTLGGAATVDGATLKQGYECDSADATAVPANNLQLGGRAAVLNDECVYVTLEGDGTDFYGGRVAPLGEWAQKENGEVVLFEFPKKQPVQGETDDINSATGRAAVTPTGDGVNVEKLTLVLGNEPADTIFQARIGDNCEAKIEDALYDLKEPKTDTFGYIPPGTDGDEAGNAVITSAAFGTLAGLKGKALQIGTLTAADGYTMMHCGEIISDVETYGYVAASLNPAGSILLQGWVSGLPATTEGTFHMHAVKNDADTQRVYPDCTDSDTIGDHVLDSDQNDNFAQTEGSLVQYNSDAAGVATLNQVVAPSAGAAYTKEDIQFNAVVFHSAAAGSQLDYELRMGCANLNTPPEFGGSAPNNPPVTSAATATTVSGVAAMAIAFVAARLA